MTSIHPSDAQFNTQKCSASRKRVRENFIQTVKEYGRVEEKSNVDGNGRNGEREKGGK